MHKNNDDSNIPVILIITLVSLSIFLLYISMNPDIVLNMLEFVDRTY